jgi:hypothetical protein
VGDDDDGQPADARLRADRRVILRMTRLVAVVMAVTAVSAAPVAAQRLPPLPYYEKGACPGECCVYRDWVAEKPVRAHRDMSRRSPLVFTVAKGERVDALTGTVVTTRAGIARVTAESAVIAHTNTRTTEQSTVRARRGDALYLLTPHGEGFYTAWFRGRLLGDVEAVLLPAPAADGSGIQQGDVEREPVIVWWAKIRNARGQIGWTNQALEDFGHQDSCGNDAAAERSIR